MNRTFLSYSLVATIIATSLVSFSARADKEDTGAIVGAIIGGLLGNQVGNGNGRVVATGLGIILGAVIGKDIGEQLDDADRRAYADAQRDCFQRPIGYQSDWDGNRYGSRTGSRGHFRTTREGYNRYNNRQVCREYESVIVTHHKTETRSGIACYGANGSWSEVNSTEVVFTNNGYGQRRPQPMPRQPMPRQPNYGGRRY